MERTTEEQLQELIQQHHIKQKARLQIQEAFILEERWEITKEQAQAEIARANLALNDNDDG